MPAENVVSKKHKKKLLLERLLGAAAVVTILAAWLVGASWAGAGVEPVLGQAYPGMTRFEKLSSGNFAAYASSSAQEPAGYVAVGEANGYGGPLKAAVGVDLSGRVVGVAVVEDKETPSYFERVMQGDFVSRLIGKSYQDGFQLGEDVDGVSGATYTSRAIADAVLKGSREVAQGELGLPAPAEAPIQVQFGLPEVTLIALFAVGYIGHRQNFKYKKHARWGSMLVGLLVLGFLYNSPLTLAYINKLLLGYWPPWQTGLYWYILIAGILFVFTVDNKNPYCEWFCPFGAAQECLGAVGGAKARAVGRAREPLIWLQRGLAWLAIVLALLFRSPGISSYEVFGTLFSLVGTTSQFILLGAVVLASLFIRRPWCGFLCPLRPVTDFIRLVRNWVFEVWTKIFHTAKTGVSAK